MQNPYRTLASRNIYRGSVFNIREDQIQKPSGTRDSFGVIEMNSGSSALPVTADRQVYLIREYKYAIERVSLEAPSGGLKLGETPLQGAQRELHEEAGLTAREWTAMGFVNPLTTQLSGPIHLYLAQGLEEVEPMPDDGEIIEIVKMPLREAFEKVVTNEITHASSCVLILRAHVLLSSSR